MDTCICTLCVSCLSACNLTVDQPVLSYSCAFRFACCMVWCACGFNSGMETMKRRICVRRANERRGANPSFASNPIARGPYRAAPARKPKPRHATAVASAQWTLRISYIRRFLVGFRKNILNKTGCSPPPAIIIAIIKYSIGIGPKKRDARGTCARHTTEETPDGNRSRTRNSQLGNTR